MFVLTSVTGSHSQNGLPNSISEPQGPNEEVEIFSYGTLRMVG